MSIKILMPALSPTMKEGNLAKWLIKKGDKVKAGEVIAEIETDKATMEIEAVDEGTITKILFAEGAEGIAVNTPIAIIGEDSAHNKNVNADNKSDKKWIRFSFPKSDKMLTEAGKRLLKLKQ